MDLPCSEVRMAASSAARSSISDAALAQDVGPRLGVGRRPLREGPLRRRHRQLDVGRVADGHGRYDLLDRDVRFIAAQHRSEPHVDRIRDADVADQHRPWAPARRRLRWWARRRRARPASPSPAPEHRFAPLARSAESLVVVVGLQERGLCQALGKDRAALIRVRGELEQAPCGAERSGARPSGSYARARATGSPSVVTVGQRFCAARPRWAARTPCQVRVR